MVAKNIVEEMLPRSRGSSEPQIQYEELFKTESCAESCIPFCWWPDISDYNKLVLRAIKRFIQEYEKQD